MATHPGMLIAYDASGGVIGTLDYKVFYDDDGRPLGLVDFATHEENGGAMTDVWTVEGAAGSKVWPEYIGGAAHEYRVVLDGPAGAKRVSALEPLAGGPRRVRAKIEAAIQARIARAGGGPVDISDLVGGPDKHIRLREPVPQKVVPLVRLDS